MALPVCRLAPSLLFHIFQVVQQAKSRLPPSVIVRQRLKFQKTKVEKLWKKCRLKILRSTQLILPLWKVMQAPYNNHYHHKNNHHRDGQDDDKVYCGASPVPLSWWLTGCGTHFPLPTGCPYPPSPLPAHLGNMISRLSWTSRKFKDISFWDTHVPCLRDIAHAACIPLHHRQLITNMTTRLKWIMPIYVDGTVPPPTDSGANTLATYM